MNEENFSDQSFDAIDPRRGSADVYQPAHAIGLRSLASLARQGPPSDDASPPGTEFSRDEFNSNSHMPDIKIPTALHSFAGFSNRTQLHIPSSGTPQPSIRLAQNKLALKSQSAQLRPGKSLQQRLNANQRGDEDPG